MDSYWFHFIMGPLVGAFIGWLTNGIAIKMLFRPLTPKYIGRWRVPFTPGIIPKERDRIARSVGAVAESLVDEVALSRTLLSEAMIQRVRDAVSGFIAAQSSNHDTLRSVILRYADPGSVERFSDFTRAQIADLVYERVSDSAFCRGVTDSLIDHIQERMRQSGVVGRALAAAGDLTRGAIAKAVTVSVTPILRSSSRDIVYRVAGSELDSFLDTPVSVLVARIGSSPDAIAEKAVGLYERAVKSKLPVALREINIAGVVERSISEMDISQVEQLLLSVMDKELKAIVRLGAVLGFLMGLLNSFF
ncbi:MAG: DUF445 family protein [Paramuribaculum sp.]|nr:DUF445 family protein [Paramuribaculum sp.]